MAKAPFNFELNKKSEMLLERITKHAGKVSLLNSFRAIGISYRKEVKGIFEKKQVRDASLKWPKLSPAYAARKEKEGFGTEILVRTGALKKSMVTLGARGNIADYGHTHASFGSDLTNDNGDVYGLYHDLLDEPRTKIPLRNFSLPSESTYGIWLNTIDADLRGQLRAMGVEVE